MAALEGRDRPAAIARMLGYDRLTKAREKANDDRKGLHHEIEGLEIKIGKNGVGKTLLFKSIELLAVS